MRNGGFFMTGVDRNIDDNQIENLTSALNLTYPSREQIGLSLERFIAYNENPTQLHCIRNQIAESWIRSRNYGITMDIDLSTKKVKSSTLKHVMRDNKSLIDVTIPILHKDLAFVRRYSDFSVQIFDCNGISLSLINGGKTFNSIDYVGVDLSEETIGTSSHSLSIFLNKPMLLIAPENFNKTLQNVSAAISVPIHNIKGNLSGVLTFVYHQHNDLYLANRGMLSGMIAFQLSLVKKIESGLKTAGIVPQNNTLFNTVSLLTDDSLIAVNSHGEIQNINSGAEKLLGAVSDQFKGKNVSEVISEEPLLNNALNSNKPTADFPAHILSNGTKKDCTIQIVPVDNNHDEITRFIRIKSSPINSLESFNSLYTFSDIIGTSAEIVKTKQLAQKFAGTPRNLLLLGESGTGKELFAHSIHNASRPQKPFIAINCASLPKGLIESEFFGYEAGSFTGADRKGRAGKLEMADGGTLFLDEIGDMSLELQPILLRVLEDKRMMRIGGNRYIPTNFRVIAATNKNLYELTTQNLFREDLYYRLSSLNILIPSLKNRREDITLLARHFIQKQCQEFKLPLPVIEPAVYKALLCYDWPGNIRELQNVVCTALLMAEDGIIKKTDLPQEISTSSPVKHLANGLKTIYQAEEQAINDAMINAHYNIKKASIALGIGRNTLYRKLKKYNICTIDTSSPKS
jgi:transcriptional regulator with PAS, ATPase and Fis domain